MYAARTNRHDCKRSVPRFRNVPQAQYVVIDSFELLGQLESFGRGQVRREWLPVCYGRGEEGEQGGDLV
jgi:hypothetical protein